jgi:predicted metal-dependent hydrolase
MPKPIPESKTPPASRALQLELALFNFDEVPVATTGDKRRTAWLGSQKVEYTFRRARRRSIGFAVDEQGLTVSAPRWVTLAQVEEAIQEKGRWILAKLGEVTQRRGRVPRVRWEHGGSLPYLGAPVTLAISPGARRADAVRLDSARRELHIALPPQASAQQIKDRVQGWLQGEARRVFVERLADFAPRLNVKYQVLRLSSAKTRWGSCTADGKILLNWRLIHFPMSSIDYVVAHELAHLREMNHGPRFWRTVAEVLPGFEEARAQLNDPPPEFLPLL